MSRVHLLASLALLYLSSACIDVPEVVDPPAPETDAGSQPPPDAGPSPDAGSVPVPDFTLTAAPLQDSVFQGEEKAFQLTIARSEGFTGSVSINLVAAPTEIVAQPTTIPSGATTATLRVAVSAGAALGNHTLTMRAVSGSLTRDAAILLNVIKPGDLLVRWTSPTTVTSNVNGPVTLDVAVEGGTAEAVEFRNGSTLLARLTTPPYSYTWDTTQAAEGEYRITAYAIRSAQVFPSFERALIVDRTAPRIGTRTPAQREENVSARAIIEVTFTEPLKPSTVTANNVTIKASGGMDVEKNLALSSDGRQLTLTPAAPLPTPSTLTVHLGTSSQPITDMAGNPLVVIDSWTFTAPAWLALGSAISAYPGTTAAENAVIKIGPSGKPIIAWSEPDGTTKNIHVSQWTGTSWASLGSPLSALPAAGTDATQPDLVVTPGGQIIASWTEKTGTGNGTNVYLNRWTGETWASLPEIPLKGSSETFFFNSKLGATADGTIYLYAGYFGGATSQTRAFSLPPQAAAWTPLNVYSSPEQHSSAPKSLATYGNNIFIAYDAYFDALEKRTIGVLNSHQTQLGREIIANQSGCIYCNPSIALNGAGAPLVAWSTETASDAAQGKIHFTQWIGSSWQSAQLVSASSTYNETPALAHGEDGVPVVAWSGFVPPEQVILVYRRMGSVWEPLGTPLSARTGASTAGRNPSLTLEGGNRPIVAWSELDGTTPSIFVYQYNN